MVLPHCMLCEAAEMSDQLITWEGIASTRLFVARAHSNRRIYD
ncbi:hypothetical protein SynBIOSE41_03735 [Synechococcus sp. BIOS-E4-1]|nr:hypothetical protein SynBIOSE41_03735 [Synechococcus sp. BIOS-E4-1]